MAEICVIKQRKMTKQISFTSQGKRADIGDIVIYRILPNRYAEAVGPFVFLDHIAPVEHPAGKAVTKAGTGAHPHRGIATLTYILSGDGEHFDSRGHHGRVRSGGIQWMSAGNGILHDETLNPDSQSGSNSLHGFQFWINLPPAEKAQAPAYLAIEAADVPRTTLPNDGGWLKVIAGEYGGLRSAIPSFSKQLLYHVHLHPGATFTLPTDAGLEYAAFLPEHPLDIGGTAADAGDFIEFDRLGGDMVLRNPSATAADIILFGGEPYTDPIVAQGPFVMNTHQEIAGAYTDFFNGKYGEISYPAEQDDPA